MPASRHEELDADLAAIFSGVGIKITWSGNTYLAAVADPRVELNLQSGGFMPGADFQVKPADDRAVERSSVRSEL